MPLVPIAISLCRAADPGCPARCLVLLQDKAGMIIPVEIDVAASIALQSLSSPHLFFVFLQDKAGMIIPVEITVYEDRSFTFVLKTPPASGALGTESRLAAEHLMLACVELCMCGTLHA